MLCSYCSTPNPDTHRFCGECGQPLVRQQVTVPAEYGRGEEPHQTTISGPSFLGLTDTSADEQTDYLLEDEHPRRSHAGWVIFSLVALVLLGVVGWLEWNAIKTGQIDIPWLKSSATASSPKPTEPAPDASATPANPEAAASPSGEKPKADNAAADGSSGGDAGETNSSARGGEGAKSSTADDKSAAGAEKSDLEATHAAETRIASDAAQRRAQAQTSEDRENTGDDNTDAEHQKPAPKAKSVKAVAAKPPDPRQDQMLIAGEKYLYGRGVAQDCNQALVYFKAAAERDNAPAMSHLGAMYASGHCVTANKVTAYKWFSRASAFEPGNQWIARSLNMIWRDMTPQERASVAR